MCINQDKIIKLKKKIKNIITNGRQSKIDNVGVFKLSGQIFNVYNEEVGLITEASMLKEGVEQKNSINLRMVINESVIPLMYQKIFDKIDVNGANRYYALLRFNKVFETEYKEVKYNADMTEKLGNILSEFSTTYLSDTKNKNTRYILKTLQNGFKVYYDKTLTNIIKSQLDDFLVDSFNIENDKDIHFNPDKGDTLDLKVTIDPNRQKEFDQAVTTAVQIANTELKDARKFYNLASSLLNK